MTMAAWIKLAATAALTRAVSASVSTQCPKPDLCFKLNVPDVSLNSGNSDLYLHINGSKANSWVAIAQGEQMMGAHFFVVYTSNNGAVTVSPRTSAGHDMPEFTPDTKIEVLEGSGVNNGYMIANIKCSNCSSWVGGSMDLTTQETSWIWAQSTGEPMNADSRAAPIGIHDSHGILLFDSSSHGGKDENPFFTHHNTTAPAPGHNSPSHNGQRPSRGPPARIVKMYTAHAILACIAWTFIFPLGGIMIRLFSFPSLLHTHAYLQLCGYAIYIAAVGLGVQLSINPRYWRLDNKHAIIGLSLFILFFFQGFTGYIHHIMYVKTGGRTLWSYIHLWSGRVGIVLGMTNAGFGFQLTGKDWRAWEVKAYTAASGLVGCAYVGSIVVGEMRRHRMRAGNMVARNEEEKRSGSLNGSEGTQTPRKVSIMVAGKEA